MADKDIFKKYKCIKDYGVKYRKGEIYWVSVDKSCVYNGKTMVISVPDNQIVQWMDFTMIDLFDELKDFFESLDGSLKPNKKDLEWGKNKGVVMLTI